MHNKKRQHPMMTAAFLSFFQVLLLWLGCVLFATCEHSRCQGMGKASARSIKNATGRPSAGVSFYFERPAPSVLYALYCVHWRSISPCASMRGSVAATLV